MSQVLLPSALLNSSIFFVTLFTQVYSLQVPRHNLYSHPLSRRLFFLLASLLFSSLVALLFSCVRSVLPLRVGSGLGCMDCNCISSKVVRCLAPVSGPRALANLNFENKLRSAIQLFLCWVPGGYASLPFGRVVIPVLRHLCVLWRARHMSVRCPLAPTRRRHSLRKCLFRRLSRRWSASHFLRQANIVEGVPCFATTNQNFD